MNTCLWKIKSQGGKMSKSTLALKFQKTECFCFNKNNLVALLFHYFF